MDIKKKYWEESYNRKENFIYYPYEQVVKFLNRFVRKKVGVKEYIDIIKPDGNRRLRGLDFGCGIGAQTRLMHDFGIEAYGIDISEVAIKEAKLISKWEGYEELIDRFIIYDGKHIPFEDNFFDICISEGVLDSMPFDLALHLIREIDRVTSKLAFISLISGDDSEHYREYDGEEEVKAEHEKGTIQSYFNYTKILKLVEGTNFNIKWCRLIQEIGVNHKYKYGRYYIVLEKTK